MATTFWPRIPASSKPPWFSTPVGEEVCSWAVAAPGEGHRRTAHRSLCNTDHKVLSLINKLQHNWNVAVKVCVLQTEDVVGLDSWRLQQTAIKTSLHAGKKNLNIQRKSCSLTNLALYFFFFFFFFFRCLIKWLEVRKVCPLCNMPVLQLAQQAGSTEPPVPIQQPLPGIENLV